LADLVAQVREAKLPSAKHRKRIRKAAGVSARDMARLLEVDTMTVLRWEKGETTPTRQHAIAYRRLLEALEEAAS
jgi:DNA-binding transcriptional regulator YiaG